MQCKEHDLIDQTTDKIIPRQPNIELLRIVAMIMIVAVSVLLLVGFSKIKIGNSRVINAISSATFGVYLIHDDSYVRPWLWKTVFANAAADRIDNFKEKIFSLSVWGKI